MARPSNYYAGTGAQDLLFRRPADPSGWAQVRVKDKRTGKVRDAWRKLPSSQTRGKASSASRSASDIAREQVDAALAPILAELGIRGQKTQQNQAGIYEALAQSQAQVAPQIQQTYQTAQANTAAFGKGFSDALRAQQGDSAAEANIILAQNNSPQQVQGDTGAGDVLFGLGGAIPGRALAREGAAFTSAAQALPGQARTLGAQAQSQTLGDVEEQISKIEAERPGLIQTALDEIRQAQFQQQELSLKQAVAESEFGLKIRKQDFEEYESTERLKLGWAGMRFKSQQALSKAQKAAAEGARPDATLSKVYGYIVDENGVPVLDGRGKRIPIKKDGKGNISPATKSEAIKRGQDAGSDSLEKLTDKIWANIPGSSAKEDSKEYAAAEAEYRKRLSQNFGTAMAQVRQAIGPHLRAIGWTQAQIKREARRLVSQVITR